MPRKNQVMFVKPEEPSFLKKIKAKIGYKEGPNLDSKHEKLPDATDEDFADQDDEKPVVVLTKNSKISEEEAEEFIKNFDEGKTEVEQNRNKDCNEDDELESGGRLIFKKPDKLRDDESTSGIIKGTKRVNDKSSSRAKIIKLDDNRKDLKDKRLLSFGEDEDE